MPPPALFCFVFKFLKNFFKLFCLYTSRGLSFPSYVTPRDIFPGHGDLGTDFLWGFLCKKSPVSKQKCCYVQEVRVRALRACADRHLSATVSKQSVLTSAMRNRLCRWRPPLSPSFFSLFLSLISFSLFPLFFPHSLQGTIISTFPVFSLHVNYEKNGW